MQCEPPKLYCGKAFKSICKKYQSFEQSYEISLRAVTEYFDNPNGVDKPSRLVLLADHEKYQLWKLRGVMVKGLKPGQWPRLWFAILPAPKELIPLVLNSHQFGYEDNECEVAALRQIRKHLGLPKDG